MTMSHSDSDSTVMATAVITDAEADSPCPHDDSRGVRNWSGQRQSQPESRKRGERK